MRLLEFKYRKMLNKHIKHDQLRFEYKPDFPHRCTNSRVAVVFKSTAEAWKALDEINGEVAVTAEPIGYVCDPDNDYGDWGVDMEGDFGVQKKEILESCERIGVEDCMNRCVSPSYSIVKNGNLVLKDRVHGVIPDWDVKHEQDRERPATRKR